MAQNTAKVEPDRLEAMLEVQAIWDSEAGVWVAESTAVPGLIAEARSPNELNTKLRTLIPELLEFNNVEGGHTQFHVRYQHEDVGALTY